MRPVKSFLSCFVMLLLLGSPVLLMSQQSNKPDGQTQVGSVNPSIVHTGSNYGGPLTINYVREWEAMGRYTDIQAFNVAGYTDVKQSTQYFDGLGRPLQSVMRQFTPGPNPMDLVITKEYDAFGREAYKYLPYAQTTGTHNNDGTFKLSPFSDQADFYTTQYKDGNNQIMYAGEQIFYDKTIYEKSPLNRIVKTFAPGNSWAGSEGSASERALSMEYLFNILADNVRVWNITNDPLTYINNDETTNVPISTSAYNQGTLYKYVIKDEQGNVTVEYKDMEGKIILRKVQVGDVPADYSGYDDFLCTYYVYDDLDQLRFVIPPKAVESIKANWSLTPADLINELCFRFEFDEKGRLIAKKVPGAGWTYMIYDARDRLVFTQDANMRVNNQWMATLFDVLNRPVLTGIITYNDNPVNLQQLVTSQTTSGVSGLPFNLVLDYTTSGIYQALESITLNPGFESITGAEFISEVTTGSGEITTIEGVAVNLSPIPEGSNFIALAINHYDDYAWTSKSFTDTYNPLLDAGNNLHAETLPTIVQQEKVQTNGKLTGTSVRVISDPANLAAGEWLYTALFYDDRGRLIQIQRDDCEQVTEIETSRYSFAGRLLSSYLVHNNPAATPSQTSIKTNIEYDHSGRVLEIWKTINDESTTKALIVKNEYDELGGLLKKELGKEKDLYGNYTTIPVGVMSYNYNVRGWLQGINKDYTNGVSGAGNWFGMELNYEWGFGIDQFNGNISGVKWRSRGDGERRAYGFTYDKVSRLLGADFSQHDGSGYVDNAVIRFDMQMGDGVNASSAYDANGNIKAMKHWGTKIAEAVVIDDLVYNYFNNTNKLSSVSEQGTGQSDHKLGDFTDKNISGSDYGYDGNGNLITDLNKKLMGTTGRDLVSGGAIKYNHMNLPWQITVRKDDGSFLGTITYVYSASGTKLKKIISEDEQPTKTVHYAGKFVYENNVLQFFHHEEGRTRYTPASGLTAAKFDHDYFIKDHLGNVRIVLTEEVQQDVYPAATLEGEITNESEAVFIEKQFYSIDPNRIVEASSLGLPQYRNKNGGENPTDEPVNNNPNSVVTDYSQKLYKLPAAGSEGTTGLSFAIKVMSGDRIDIWGKSYYSQQNNSGENYNIPVLGILDGFLNTPGAAIAGKTTVTELNGLSVLTNALNAFLNHPDRDDGGSINTPKAYINYILLDENFRYKGGGFSRVSENPNELKNHFETDPSMQNIEVLHNGYIYVYVSNESPVDVYFDNLQIVHTRGSLIEETHYYPFGLTMAGISSKATGELQNKYQFNGGNELQNDEFTNGSGLELYNAHFRMYDPQIGRFHSVDPLADFYTDYTPFNFVYNNPILLNDPYGLSAQGGISEAAHRGYVYDPKKGEIIFDPDVHSQNDLDPKSGLTYLGEQIIVTQNGITTWWDDHGNPSNTDPSWGTLPAVTVTGRKATKGRSYQWYQFFNDHNPGGDFLYELNKWNPLAIAVNSVKTYATGSDTYGVQQSNTEATIQLSGVFLGGIARVGNVVVSAGSKAFKHSYKYAARIRQRALQDPVAHNFPYSFDDLILAAKPIIQKDGSYLYRMAGSLNGKDGFFEIALNSVTGIIFHRTFVGGK